MRRLYLASASARRQEILAALGIDFTAHPQDLDESLFDHVQPRRRVVTLALAKAEAAREASWHAGTGIILAADTLVCDPEPTIPAMDGHRDASGSLSFGKAQDRKEARLMLGFLAGRSHEVHTGLAALDLASGRVETGLSTSTVHFSAMSPGEMEAYLDSGEWEGVAGAYRIQGRAAFFIDRIEGSWSGIVGLPIHELYGMLTRLDFTLSPKA